MGYTHNIIGEPLNKVAQDQLQTRSNMLKNEGRRESNDLIFLTNNNCWIKMTSLIDIEDSEILQKKFKGIGSTPAKNWVLFGGTKLETGDIKSGLEAYNVGLENPLQELGYRPMPGILSATINTLGTLGSLRSAEVVIRANTKEQLDALDILFFRLGFSCLLEWGHVMYLDSTDPASPKIESFQSSDLVRAFDQENSKEKILQHLAKTRKKTFGNYDGMLGLITNYNWNALEDGSYQCTVKLTGIGSVLDSLKINNNDFGEITPYAKSLINQLDVLREEGDQIDNKAKEINAQLEAQIKKVEKERETLQKQREGKTRKQIGELEKQIYELGMKIVELKQKQKVLPEETGKQLTALDKKITPVKDEINKYKSEGKSNSNLAFGSTLEGFLNDLKIAFTESVKKVFSKNEVDQARPFYLDGSNSTIIGRDYLNSIGLNLYPTDASLNVMTDANLNETVQGKPGTLQHAFNYGFNSSILLNFENSQNIPAVNFRELTRVLVINTNKNTDKSNTGPVFYIKLGALLAFINNGASLYCRNSTGEKKPLVYIDFNPKTNICYTSKYQFSINPEVCLIPYRLDIVKYIDLFLINKIDDSDAQKLADSAVNGEGYPVNNTSTKMDLLRGFNNYKTGEDKNQQAHLMEIDVSIDYLLLVLRNSQGNSINSSIGLTQFLQTVLGDIQKSLGNVNNFRIGYNDEANCLTIYDDQIVNIKETKTLSAAKPIPVYGLSSIAKGFSMNTETSTKLGSLLAITAQSPKTAKESSTALNQDGSAFTQLNNHLKDRIMPLKTSSPKKEETKPVPDPNLLVNIAGIFNEYVRSYYTNVPITNEDGNINKTPTLNLLQRDAAINFYIGTLNKLKGTPLSQTANGIKKSNITANGIMPISCNIKLTGLSTLTLYEGFTLPINRLPSQYVVNSEPSVGFVISGITHTIQNNNWDTDIKGAMINIPDYEVDESISIGSFNFDNEPLNIPVSVNNGGREKEICGIVYKNGYMPDNALQPIKSNLYSEYIGNIKSDGSRIRLSPGAMIMLEKMLVAATAAGIDLRVNSAYRSYEDQRSLYENVTPAHPVGKPGISNHGFGLAVDLADAKLTGVNPRRTPKEWNWLSTNASKFFFQVLQGDLLHWNFIGNPCTNTNFGSPARNLNNVFRNLNNPFG